MKTLATITEQDINPAATVIDTGNFAHRRAVRAVVLDTHGRVALLKVTNYDYHKLPGGGIHDGENMHQALERELSQEIGSAAEIISEIGKIDEYRDKWQQFQESYCYLALLIGDQGAPTFTQEEQDDGFEPRWADSIDDAIAILKADKPKNYDGQHIKPRDLLFLKTAQAICEQA